MRAPARAGAALALRDGADWLDGGAGNDLISGAGGADTLIGGSGNDVLAGDWGDDLLRGGGDDDRLTGGLGADLMYGGAGRDVFVLGIASAPLASGLEAGQGAARDVIGDFARGQDLLDLSGIARAGGSWSWQATAEGVLVTVAAGAEVGEVLLRGLGTLGAGDVLWG
jgi:Ca2+-binding RTX toxin-like protein